MPYLVRSNFAIFAIPLLSFDPYVLYLSLIHIEMCIRDRYRLNAAAEALQATDETVLTIASRCGFENLS